MPVRASSCLQASRRPGVQAQCGGRACGGRVQTPELTVGPLGPDSAVNAFTKKCQAVPTCRGAELPAGRSVPAAWVGSRPAPPAAAQPGLAPRLPRRPGGRREGAEAQLLLAPLTAEPKRKARAALAGGAGEGASPREQREPSGRLPVLHVADRRRASPPKMCPHEKPLPSVPTQAPECHVPSRRRCGPDQC